MSLVLLVGGARSGKSNHAVDLARRHDAPVVFIATATAEDDDMTTRIQRHRSERPDDWSTVEEPVELKGAIDRAPARSCVVLDCLTLWVANLIDALDPAEIEVRATAAAQTAASRQGLTIAVTNEVGLGVVPATEIGRDYRDLLGRVNTIWASEADRVFLLVAGRAIELARLDDLIDGPA